MLADADRWPGPSAQAVFPGPSANDEQRQLRAVARIDDVVDPLVGVEPRNDQEEAVVPRGVGREALGIHRRGHDDPYPTALPRDAAGTPLRAGRGTIHTPRPALT